MEEPEQLDYHIYKEFQIQERIGKGTYGIVYKVIHKKTKKIFAIKKIIDAFQNLIDAKRTYRELNYLLQLHHPAIVHLEYVLAMPRHHGLHQPSTTRLAVPSQEIRGCNTDKLAQNPFKQQRHVYAVFQYVETDLRVVLKRCSELQAIQRKFIGYQLLQGIAFLHRSGLVHRDIKPENLLLNCNKLQLKICDFGMARLQASVANNQSVLTQYVASRWYRPPEALLGITTCQPAIDLWSVGCVLAELALGTPLFAGKSTLDQLQIIFRAIGLPSQSQIAKLQSQQAQYVIKNFSFSRKSKNKPLKDTLSNCCNTQIDLIIRLLTFDPTSRISAQQALRHEYFDEVREVNQQLQSFAHSKADIKDKSDKLSNDKNKSAFSVEQYRCLIEELERFVEKSSNRSVPLSKGQFAPTVQKVEILENNPGGMQQKSTKESNFVSENKQHFLRRAQEAILKKAEEQKYQDQHSKHTKFTKEARLNSTSKKQTKKQKVLNLLSSDKPKGQSLKKNQKKPKPKLEQYAAEESKVHAQKRDSKDPLKNRKSIKGDPEELNDKITKKNLLIGLVKSKSPGKIKDNISFLSNKSKTNSMHSNSKEKSKVKSPNLNTTQMSLMAGKEGVMKKLAKPSVPGSKSGLIKCKSAKHMNQFKK